MSDQTSFAAIPGLENTTLDSAVVKVYLKYKADQESAPPPYNEDPRRGSARRRSRTANNDPQPGDAGGARTVRFSGGDASARSSAGSRSVPQHTDHHGPHTSHAVIDPEIGCTETSSAYTWSGCASFIRDQATSALSAILPWKDDISDGMAVVGKTLSCAVVVGLATSLACDLIEGGDGSKWGRQVSAVGEM